MLITILLILIILLLLQICFALTNIKIEIKYNNILFEEQNEKLKQKKEDETS
tara:strand:- start:1421 stop:1576 length:156 start_codon:yes stop_codon:yes gene_type:complete